MNVTALNSPSFRLYLFGSFIALNGLWVQRVIIGWLAWELTGSPAFVGLAAFLSLAPTIISGPIFGVIIDRTNIRIAFFLSYSGMIICSILLFSLIKTELLTTNSLLIICLFIGFIASAAHPIRMSLAPRLVDDIHLPSMVILTAVNFNTSRLIGPAVGGILIQTFDVSGAILCSIFSFIPAIGISEIIKLPKSFFTLMINLKVQFRTFRNDTSWINCFVAVVVMLFDVLEVYRLLYSGHLV